MWPVLRSGGSRLGWKRLTYLDTALVASYLSYTPWSTRKGYTGPSWPTPGGWLKSRQILRRR